MIRVYLQENLLLVLSEKEFSNLPQNKEFDWYRVLDENDLDDWLDFLETKAQYIPSVVAVFRPKRFIEKLSLNYKLVEAAGGLVFNEKDELLMIYRRGFWDLPKGKLDPGESNEEAALREVREETGVKKLQLVAPLHLGRHQEECTYHTFTRKGRRVWKKVYWYEMFSKFKGVLIPEEEEDIEEARWVSPAEAMELLDSCFGSVKDAIISCREGNWLPSEV
ncbi:NUDIX domain-containing protein [Chitinophagales bacterium]|nr:NUDIX domain-containing protein [Chitinophagales bacterium]